MTSTGVRERPRPHARTRTNYNCKAESMSNECLNKTTRIEAKHFEAADKLKLIYPARRDAPAAAPKSLE